MTEEERVGLGLPWRGRGALDDAGAAARQPPEERRRARGGVGAGAIDEPGAAEPGEPVVDGTLRT